MENTCTSSSMLVSCNHGGEIADSERGSCRRFAVKYSLLAQLPEPQRSCKMGVYTGGVWSHGVNAEAVCVHGYS